VSIDRRQARILAMQALCHHDAQGAGFDDALGILAGEAAADASTVDYARALGRYVIEAGHVIDARIRGVLQHWELDRIAAAERNVLRVALAELLRRETPPKVAIDEAIEIAREFGSAESSKFVNGVLDAAWKKLQEEP